MLSLKQLKDVCLFNHNEDHLRCRYLEQDENDWGVFYCLKKNPKKKEELDKQIDLIVDKFQKEGKNPMKERIPLGDNCGGYLKLRYIEQGYDQQ